MLRLEKYDPSNMSINYTAKTVTNLIYVKLNNHLIISIPIINTQCPLSKHSKARGHNFDFKKY